MKFEWYNRHALRVTILIFGLILLVNWVKLDLHFLNPLGYGIRDYDVTDIVYSQLREQHTELESRIVLINTGYPDRARIAAIVDRLLAAETAVIGLDVYFPDRKDPAVDSLLEQALMRGGGNIVLAANLGQFQGNKERFEHFPDTDTLFTRHCTTGFINFPGNTTSTIRNFSPAVSTGRGTDFAFGVAIAHRYDKEKTVRFLEQHPGLQRIHYSVTEDNFIRLQADQVLDTLNDIKKLVADKIVIIGYSGRDDWNEPMLDKHYTPMNPKYAGKSPPDMYGYVIHANIVKMILDGKFIRQIPIWFTFVFAFLLCYLNVLIPMWIHGKWYAFYYLLSRVLQIVQLAGFFFLIAFLFDRYLIKWDFSTGFTALAMVVDIQVVYTALLRHYRHRIMRILPTNQGWFVRLFRRKTQD